MAIATWWQGDVRPQLPELSGFTAERRTDLQFIADLNKIEPKEVAGRIDGGHRPYIASLNGAPAAYGWVATRGVSLGELDLNFALPAADRYLWDFATLPSFRGKGVYPALLDAIRRHEGPDAERLWIIYAPENLPSGVGIGRAGFQTVADLSYTSEGAVALRPIGTFLRARAAAQLLGVSIVGEPLTTCWRCAAGEGCGCRSSGNETCSCHIAAGWPAAVSS